MESPTSNLSLGFKLTPEVVREIETLLNLIEEDATQDGLSANATEILSHLLSLAIDQFYFDFINQLHTHTPVRASADKGISTIIKAARLVIQKMVYSLDPALSR